MKKLKKKTNKKAHTKKKSSLSSLINNLPRKQINKLIFNTLENYWNNIKPNKFTKDILK
jgi:hypothetical protein